MNIRRHIKSFLRDTRAGATAIVAAVVTLMTLGGTALIGDHVWLVDQRDSLKSALDAAGIAATLEMDRLLNQDPDISDSDLVDELQKVATGYIELNLSYLPAERLAQAKSTLVVEVTLDRVQRTVNIAAEADLGGPVLAKILPWLADQTQSSTINVASEVRSLISPVEVVLALDVSASMTWSMTDTRRPWNDSGVPTRMEVVKDAALNLVGVLDPNDVDGIAIGVVPWSAAVRLDEQMAGEWETNNWARYPTRRTYGVPWSCKPTGSCAPPPPVEQDVAPLRPEPWRGCLDGHRMGTVGTRAYLAVGDALLEPPSQSAFSQGYFSAHEGAAYECMSAPVPARFRQQLCYRSPVLNRGQFKIPKQWPCYEADPPSTILPLSTDRARIEQVIDALLPNGPRTYSALGVLWGQRLLQHSWNDVWGGGTHPADPASADNPDLRKAIVLLTDGEDTYCGTGNIACENSAAGTSRAAACDAAKAAGTEIFVVSAMAPTFISADLAETLSNCSSQADNPDGAYVFLDTATPEALQAAFADIASQLRTVRRSY